MVIVGELGWRGDYQASVVVDGERVFERWSVVADDEDDLIQIIDSMAPHRTWAAPRAPRFERLTTKPRQHGNNVELDFAWIPQVFLSSLLRAEGARDGLALPLVRSLLAGVASGLVALHARDERHGGLTLDRLSFGVDGAAWFNLRPYQPRTDFRGRHKFSTAKPSYGHLAPEQVRGLPTTTASDVWALGLIAFQALTGRSVFSGCDSEFELLERIRENRRPRLIDVRPDLPAPLTALVEAMLATAPADRPTCAAIIDVLDHALPWAMWSDEACAAEVRAVAPVEFDAVVDLDTRAAAALG